MGNYTPEAMACTLDKIHEGVEDINKHIETNGTDNMNDIAGLLALMQNNRGTDLPGMLALCRDRGYDRAFGNEGSFMTIFLLLFLLGNGGWGGLNAANRGAFQECAGNSCQSIIGLHDRISAAQQASNQGFFQLDTKICESIANVISAVRNQGDRAVDSTHDLQTQVQSCCCQIERSLDGRLKELGLDSEASPFMPVGSEYKGWREYCELAKQYPNDTRYKTAAADEFKHMLVRLADALAEVKNMTSAEEKTVLVDFLNEVLKEVSK